MTDTLTEFTWVEPDEVHLVGAAANGFPAPLLAKATAALDEVLDNAAFSDDGVVKYVSASARRKYAESGVAMPTGAFPIPDEGHLRSAVGRLGNYKGDKAKAKSHIVARARALHATHLLPEDWHVSKTARPTADAEVWAHLEDAADAVKEAQMDQARDDAEKQTAPNKAVPRSEAESQTREVSEDAASGCDPDNEDGGESHESGWTADMHTGEGTTADDKAVPRAEADSQTPGAQKDTGTGRGDTAPDGEAEARSAETESESQTNEVEKLSTHHKEIETMTHDELVKLLDERDEARRQAKKEAKKAEAAKAEKREKKAAKAAEKAAKAADEGADNPELVKALERVEAAEKAAKEARELAEKMASEDARRVVTDPTGIVTALRTQGASENVFKQLEDELAAAKEAFEKNPSRANEARMQDAGRRVVSAKLIAQDTARSQDPQHTARIMRGEGTPLFQNSQPFNDPKVRYVR